VISKWGKKEGGEGVEECEGGEEVKNKLQKTNPDV